MLGYIAHGVTNPFARLWLAASEQSWRQLPTPSDRPLVHAPGADPRRMLLLGSGVAVGYGVMSHDLALGGHLARELSALTGHGASVDIIANGEMSPSTARTALGALDLSRFDVVVLTLGGLEALTLMPAGLWRRQLERLLSEVQRIAPAGLPVVVIETSVPLLAGLPMPVRSFVSRAAERINTQTEELCARFEDAAFVAFAPPQGDVSTLTGRDTYRGWAEMIAPAVARVLAAEGRARHPETLDEPHRQRSVDDLDLDSVPIDQLERIVANTRDLLGTSGAAVTIIDRDVQVTKAAVGMPRATIPRELSICDLTVRQSEILVVEDTMTDPRLAGSLWADGARGRFYAGYPLESPDGQRIGALCVVDQSPRRFSGPDAALLRQLALRVQSVLWGNEVLS